MPRVTVIIPTFNWSTVLPYSIGSVLAQNFADFELLVVGDGCTDDSAEVVGRFTDPRVRWIAIPRHGHQSGPNNEGIRQAQGDLIAYLNHDDLWLPNHLRLAVAAIDAGADFTRSIVGAVPPDSPGAVPWITTTTGWFPPSCVVHRRRVIDATGPWPDYRTLSIGPEQWIWERTTSLGFAVEFIPRLTAIKFPAAWRKDAYEHRRANEQAAWFARMRQEPDFEARVVASMLVDARREVDRLNWWRLALGRAVRWRHLFRAQRGGNIKRNQRFKGVAPTRPPFTETHDAVGSKEGRTDRHP